MSSSHLNYPGARSSPEEPLWRTIYRFLWPFPYFRDVTRGKKLERQQNYRHNREMRVYLPGFAFKWAMLTVLCFGLGMALGSWAAPPILRACLFLAGSWSLVVSLLMLTAWFWLTRFPELY